MNFTPQGPPEATCSLDEEEIMPLVVPFFRSIPSTCRDGAKELGRYRPVPWESSVGSVPLELGKQVLWTFHCFTIPLASGFRQ